MLDQTSTQQLFLCLVQSHALDKLPENISLLGNDTILLHRKASFIIVATILPQFLLKKNDSFQLPFFPYNASYFFLFFNTLAT